MKNSESTYKKLIGFLILMLGSIILFIGFSLHNASSSDVIASLFTTIFGVLVMLFGLLTIVENWGK